MQGLATVVDKHRHMTRPACGDIIGGYLRCGEMLGETMALCWTCAGLPLMADPDAARLAEFWKKLGK